MRTLPFPLSLARHLANGGYGPLPPSLAEVDPNLLSANFARPSPVEPDSARTPSIPATPPSNESNAGGQEGSGFFVATNILVTNAHVVEGCSNVAISVGGVISQGTVAARDAVNDLAATRTTSAAPAIAKLRSGSRLGEEVSVFGFPLNGLLATGGNFTRGNITATAGLGDDSRFFQISDPVQPGNSGGPLLDESGNVIGVVTAKLNALRLAAVTNDVAQNINFAIKASAVKSFLEANSITFQEGTAGSAMAAPDVAALAQSFTTIVACQP
jgi:S1-C subfamily serine protease